MDVEYNDVKLTMGEIQSIHRTAVWDDTHTHLLYIKWELGIVAMYSPHGYPPGVSALTLRRTHFFELPPPATGFLARLAGIAPKIVKLFRGKNAAPTVVNLREPSEAVAADPIGTAGFGAILTDNTIRNRLLTPRKTLRISGFDSRRVPAAVDLLVSPKPGYVCDPVNGPHPIACDILNGTDGGFAVFFQIETATLPCDDDSDRLILSHVWRMTHTHSQDQYLVRVVEGELTLNGSMIHTYHANADQFRRQFFHPIPLGCERVVPFVSPSSDGLTYHYRYEDHDKSIVFDPGHSGATNMEIIEKAAYVQPWRVLGAVNLG